MKTISEARLAEMLAAAGTATRLTVLRRLHGKALNCGDPAACDMSQRCCSVSELARGTGVTLATVSHHLKELRRAGLITMQRRGRHVFCALDREAMRALAEVFGGWASGGSP